MADISLQLQAENFQAEDLQGLLVEGHWKPILKRLRTAENLLLEGCRGSGKTMLMRTSAERMAAEARSGGRVLGVHATFKRYLATIPPPGSPESIELGNFKAWVNASILDAVRERVATTFGPEGLVKVGHVSRVNWKRIKSALETTYRGPVEYETLNEIGLTPAEFKALQGYTFPSELLQGVRTSLGLELLVLLLDDAAHVLDTRAQGAFFTLVKSLYTPGLAFKISVYPAVTRYGVDFAYGHDAVVVPLNEIPVPATMDVFFDMLRRRREFADGGDAGALIGELMRHPDWAKLLVYCANGNPRSVIKLVAHVLTELRERPPEQVRYEDVRAAINAVTDRHLENMIPGVVKDLDPRLLKAAEELLEHCREKFRSSPGPLESDRPRMFLAISNSPQIPYICAAATRLLVAANVLTYAQAQRLSNRENGSAYLLHPGFVFRDNVLGRTVPAERWVQHFDAMSPKVHAELTKSAPLWIEVRDAAMEEPSARCVNGHPLMDASSRCEECGAPALQRGPAAILLEKPIEVLDLSDRIKERLHNAGYTTVRSVFEATEEQLDSIPYIGTSRTREIRSAVEAAVDEYFAG